ncbi:MAG: TonB-dependent receptor [Calditrichales bacterium]|nr:TonB-dependent receptor [Calditrichales bacterium]
MEHYNFKVSEYHSYIFITKNDLIQTKLPSNFNKIKTYGFYRDETQNESKYLKSEEEYISNVRTIGTKDKDTKSTAVFSGKILTKYEKNPLTGVVLKVRENGKSTISDKNGNYSFNLKKGVYTIEVSSVEIEPTVYEIHLYSDGELDLFPERTYVSIEEVTIHSEKFHNVKSMIIGFEELSVMKSADIPSSLGENDVIKAGLLLPGVQTIGEGNAGINVRGAPADQNMFYLDGLPLYNTSHFLGFFSSFNSLAIKNLNIYKSSLPIQYGNNLSSVFDIKVKEGLTDKYSGSFNLSPITLSLLAEGPIIKKKSSFLISFRTTYSNWVLSLIDNLDINESQASFKDMITNFSYKVNNKNSIKLLAYYSNDNINLSKRNIYDYQVKGIKLSWDKTVLKKHGINSNIVYSNYEFTESNYEGNLYSFMLPYKFDHFGINSKLNLHFDKHDINIGTDNILFMIDQGSVEPADTLSLISPIELYTEKAVLFGIFASDSWKINDYISLKTAVRLNSYHYLGERSMFIYNENSEYSSENIIDTTDYKNFERIKSYTHPDIRITANYKFNENFSVKAGYSYMYQYLFMMTNTISASPTNKFKLTDQYLSPIKGQQVNLGFYSNLYNNKYILSIETYYKKVDNYKDYKDGANIIFNEVPEFDIINAELDLYGIEFMLKKNIGKLNGWINYTYSNSMVSTDNNIYSQSVNMGKPYHANYDKPHSLNIVTNYKFSRRFNLSANLVYSTGRPITYPVGLYYQNKMQIPYYTTRNEYRVPDYFRVDVSARFEGSLKKNKIAHGTWIFSVYNLTGRNNAYSVFFKTEDGRINAYKMSIFAIPIFSVSYQLKHGNYADKYY